VTDGHRDIGAERGETEGGRAFGREARNHGQPNEQREHPLQGAAGFPPAWAPVFFRRDAGSTFFAIATHLIRWLFNR
jgi:hypothetical protein